MRSTLRWKSWPAALCISAASLLRTSIVLAPLAIAGCSSPESPAETFELSVVASGSGSGQVTSRPTGIGCLITGSSLRGSCTASFKSGTSVLLEPQNSSGSTFSGWLSGCAGSGSCTVQMQANTLVHARFDSVLAVGVNRLSVRLEGDGSGGVISTPAGIECMYSGGSVLGICSVATTTASHYQLQSNAATGSVFGGWSGACIGTSSVCSLTSSGETSVTAAFRTIGNVVVRVMGAGDGAGRITSQPVGLNCSLSAATASGTCSLSVAAGSSISLIQEASSGSAFGGWSGGCGPSGTCVFSVQGRDTSIIARFNTLPSGFVASSATTGDLFSCASSLAGANYCWGSNFLGQLGIGSAITGNFVSPQQVSLETGAVWGPALGAHACAVVSPRAFCWGFNGTGQLGDGTTSNSNRPVVVLGSIAFRKVAAGVNHTCGVSDVGSIYCWGLNNSGELGDSSTIRSPVPKRVVGTGTYTEVALGSSHSCGLRIDGIVSCWGDRTTGAAGGTGSAGSTFYRIPTPVPTAVTFSKLVTGSSFTCGLSTASQAYCWGNNSDGQLGNGTFTSAGTPTLAASGRTFSSIAAGLRHACGISTDGEVYCWGRGSDGQLGNGLTLGVNPTPVRVSGNVRFREVFAGGSHTCAISTNGVLYCWGGNFRGQLGIGSLRSSSIPVEVVP